MILMDIHMPEMDNLIAKPIEVRRLMEVIEASLAAPQITATGVAA